MQRVSGNQKPIQFDENGNVYFPGTSFARTCDEAGVCTMAAADWNPRIYRLNAADLTVTQLTQDNQKISYFLVLPTGEIAYQSINTQTGDIALYLWRKTQDAANVNGTTTNLTGSTVAVDFFTVDNYNTIMWGGWGESGMRFARPAMTTSLIEKATLNTKNLWTDTTDYVCDPAFAQYRTSVGGRWEWDTSNPTKCQSTYVQTCDSMGYCENYTDQCPQESSIASSTKSMLKQLNGLKPYPPRRIVVGDDGKLYGLFVDTITKNTTVKTKKTITYWGYDSQWNWVQQSANYEYDACNDPNKIEYYTVLKIHQILPYSSIPRAEIMFKKSFPDQQFSWQQWMGSTPFQVSN